MKEVALIIIGDEILDGRISDLHVHWLSRWCDEHHLKLSKVSMIRDEESSIGENIQRLSSDHDYIIITGGLGPTLDDKTKKAIAELLNAPLEESNKARELVTHHYSRIEKVWSSDLNSYHMIPKGVEPMPNPNGLAPGLKFEFNQAQIFAVPGVPREMQAMSKEEIAPYVTSKETMKDLPFTIRTRGIPEEKIFFELCPDLWKQLSSFGKVSSLPQTMGVDIVVKTPKENHPKLEKLIKETPLIEYVWQFGHLSIEDFILERCRDKNLTLSFAESCTGGLTASRITDIAGCSDVFMGSAVTYSNEAKMALVNVKEETLIAHGAVSEETAYEMATGAREKFDSSVSLVFTGIAGPGGATPDKPVGTVCIGLSSKEKTITKRYVLKGSRVLLKRRFSERGFFDLLDFIKEL